jgi:hypothetical protein
MRLGRALKAEPEATVTHSAEANSEAEDEDDRLESTPWVLGSTALGYCPEWMNGVPWLACNDSVTFRSRYFKKNGF